MKSQILSVFGRTEDSNFIYKSFNVSSYSADGYISTIVHQQTAYSLLENKQQMQLRVLTTIENAEPHI